MSCASDKWTRWLLQERFGGSDEAYRQGMAVLEPLRDRILDGARLGPGETVLDIGCGDGLLAFGALDRTAPTGHVVFSDISGELLATCRHLADASRSSARCTFVASALPELEGIADQLADAVVIRSVLIYVRNKQLAFEHLGRVLKPGGRLSLFEPINSFGFPEPAGWLWGFDISGLEPLAERVLAAARSHQPGDSPMLGFDERDLLRWTEEAGFGDIKLTYDARVSRAHPAAGLDLATFLSISPNPTVPTRGQILEEALGTGDRCRLEERFGEHLSTGSGRTREAMSFLTARRK